MATIQSGRVQTIEALEPIYDEVRSNAPPEIEDDVDTFVTRSRAVSRAFAAAGGAAEDADVEAALALSPSERQFVEELATAAETGKMPPGSTGVVLDYVQEHCR